MSDARAETIGEPSRDEHASGNSQQSAANLPHDPLTAQPGPPRHVLIIGFGLSGRSTVNTVIEAGISYAVIETNEQVVTRCTKGGLNIIFGDARDPAILKRAGIEHATDVMVTIPNDDLTGDVVEQARRLNPTAHIVARCTFVSGGMDAHKRGADETVIGEQVVANEFAKVTAAALARKPANVARAAGP